jgi:CBS domain-containing protein
VIVRVLGHGQFRMPDGSLSELNAIDDDVQAAFDDGDEPAFQAAVHRLVDAVTSLGEPLPDAELVPSDVVVPDPETTLDEAAMFMSEEGLVPD